MLRLRSQESVGRIERKIWGVKMGTQQVTGNAGMYFVAYRLSQLDWNVMPTSRNARGVDLLIYDADAQVKKAIQVKALSKRNNVPLGKSKDNLMGDFWIIVIDVATKPFCFILTPEEVQQYARRFEKEGKTSFFLQAGQYDKPEFREAWDRIGRGGSGSADVENSN
jgi:hypothetical protein